MSTTPAPISPAANLKIGNFLTNIYYNNSKFINSSCAACSQTTPQCSIKSIKLKLCTEIYFF